MTIDLKRLLNSRATSKTVVIVNVRFTNFEATIPPEMLSIIQKLPLKSPQLTIKKTYHVCSHPRITPITETIAYDAPLKMG